MKKDINYRYFQHLMRDRGVSLRELSRRMSVDPSSLTRKFQGKRKFTPQEVVKVSQFLEVPMDEVLRELRVDVPTSIVPKGDLRALVVGEVRASGEIVYRTTSGARYVEAPGRTSASKVQALRYTGEGYLDGAHLYYKAVPEVSRSAVGRLCVCELHDGRRLLATLGPGSKRGTYTLRDLVGGLLAADSWLDSASPVLWIKVTPS